MPLLRMAEGEHLPTLHQLEVALLGEAPVQELSLGLQLPLSPTGGGGGDARADGDGEAAPPPPDAAVRLMMALLDFLVAGLFQETAQAIMGEGGAGRVGRAAGVAVETILRYCEDPSRAPHTQ